MPDKCGAGKCPPRHFGSAGMGFVVNFTPATPGSNAYNVSVGILDVAARIPEGPLTGMLPLLRAETDIEMAIFLDQTHVEVFVGKGRYAVSCHIPTSLFYDEPSNNTWQGIEIIASGDGALVRNATVWPMADAYHDVSTHDRPNHR